MPQGQMGARHRRTIGSGWQQKEVIGYYNPQKVGERRIFMRVLAKGTFHPEQLKDSLADGTFRAGVALAMSPSEWEKVGRGGFRSGDLGIETVESLRDLVMLDTDVAAVLAPGMWQLFEGAALELMRRGHTKQGTAVILLERLEPPAVARRDDGEVGSFCCSGTLFRSLLNRTGEIGLQQIPFALLDAILEGELRVDRVFAKQLPLGIVDSCPPAERVTAVIAHRGPLPYLRAALGSLVNMDSGANVTVAVGLDVENTAEYGSLPGLFSQCTFYRIEPAPAGPYVVRQALIDAAPAGALLFQDSDDLSTHDRLVIQCAEIRSRCDMAGSHELCVDQIDRKVRAVRFPLDVSEALRNTSAVSMSYKGCEPLLHATVMVRRSMFMAAGGFSTDQRIANDTQFLLRAHFSLKMRNVDEFLYIRRIHKAALTVAPATALGIPLRESLARQWNADFAAVLSGRSDLATTSLMPRRSSMPYRLLPFPDHCGVGYLDLLRDRLSEL